ncbi:1,2-oxophytodienoate reductase [Micromonospora rosaria]|uniref:1,2-oxophytodienoate reductase n=1 Tax=Micromonospora rosaria TaxID=47874 RepID=A0A136PNW3_9ACTN|nr:alkene reductase [Micromonospora rosaria]KXK60102.1 1,2-oxophytodienoate reductase [Micromonospora rosaria]
MTSAFEPATIGRYTTRSRVVMAPMTRSRAYGPGASPTELMATYYGQRAGAGLIVTEGIQPSAIGQGYLNTPGLHTDEQVAAWRPVTAAVHDRGGLIFAQLMHTGRIGHPDNTAQGHQPAGVSAVRAAGTIVTPTGPQEFPVPQPLDADGVRATIADFVTAARNAIEAGFDGVELHGANGYLLHQFLATNTNLRDDEWGGDVAGRIRFVVEVTGAVADAVGADRVGLRISPANGFNDIVEDGHRETYLALLDALNPLGLAYLHVAEGPDTEFTPVLRDRWQGTFLLNPYTPGSWTGPEALKLIETGETDLVSYGALYLANPDLPRRLAASGPFTTPDYRTAYGGDHHGYTDYPELG